MKILILNIVIGELKQFFALSDSQDSDTNLERDKMSVARASLSFNLLFVNLIAEVVKSTQWLWEEKFENASLSKLLIGFCISRFPSLVLVTERKHFQWKLLLKYDNFGWDFHGRNQACYYGIIRISIWKKPIKDFSRILELSEFRWNENNHWFSKGKLFAKLEVSEWGLIGWNHACCYGEWIVWKSRINKIKSTFGYLQTIEDPEAGNYPGDFSKKNCENPKILTGTSMDEIKLAFSLK